MLDMFNPSLREAKRRAREEYRQRMLQGKIDETMRRARERASRNLALRETIHRAMPKLLKWTFLCITALIAFRLLRR